MWLVYKTTNLINNKYYIGVHKVNSKKSTLYLGSGKLILQAIKKYGRNNFTRETLALFYDEASAYAFEKNFITDELLEDTNCYNITEGGGNPPTFYGRDNHMYGKKHPKEVMDMIKAKLKGKPSWNKNIPRTKEEKINISKAKKGKKLGIKNYLYGKKLTLKDRLKLGLVDFKKGNIPWNKDIKGAPPSHSTKCIVHDLYFTSTLEAAKCFGVSRATIRRRCTMYNFPDCYYIEVNK